MFDGVPVIVNVWVFEGMIDMANDGYSAHHTCLLILRECFGVFGNQGQYTDCL